jgi:hypothetical protein
MKYIAHCTFNVMSGSSHSTTRVALTTWVVAVMYNSIGSPGVSAVRMSGFLSKFFSDSSAS